MPAVAKEFNQSETAFVLKSKIATCARVTSRRKGRFLFAGHPTIATIHAAYESGLTAPEREEIRLEANDGAIRVESRRSAGRRLLSGCSSALLFSPRLTIPASFFPCSAWAAGTCRPGAVIQTVSTGTRQLMVLLASHESLRRLAMNVGAYKPYRAEMNFFSPHFFCLKGISADAQTFARHLGVAPDTSEDAFTGSATGGMAAYLWKHGLINSPTFIAEQGHWLGRPGRASVEVLGSRAAIESVVVAGTAATVMTGELVL